LAVDVSQGDLTFYRRQLNRCIQTTGSGIKPMAVLLPKEILDDILVLRDQHIFPQSFDGLVSLDLLTWVECCRPLRQHLDDQYWVQDDVPGFVGKPGFAADHGYVGIEKRSGAGHADLEIAWVDSAISRSQLEV